MQNLKLENDVPLRRLSISPRRCSAEIDPKMISISSKLRPLVSGMSLHDGGEKTDLQVKWRLEDSYNENTAIPPMLIVAKSKNILYPNDVFRSGVALLRTKPVGWCRV